MSEHLRKTHIAPQFERIVIMGVGGTGSYLSQGLAKLVSGYRLQVEVILVDPDTVEEKNCARQNFHPWEVGEPKATALASRFNQQYGLSFGALQGLGEQHLGPTCDASKRLVVTCVDSVEARKLCKGCGPWLDLGNGTETGQAIYGNTEQRQTVNAEISGWSKTPYVGNLPSPYLVAGMARLKSPKWKLPSCADTPFAEQGIYANEWAAAAGLAIMHQLLIKGELSTPAIYFDTAKARMTSAFITKDYLQGA